LRASRSGSNDGGSRRCFNGLGVHDGGSGLRCGHRGSIFRGRVLEGGNWGWLLDLGWVLIDLGGRSGFRLGLRLKEVTNTRGEAAADFSLLLFLLLLFFLLLLLQI
jgi:hypothetical protein